MPSIKGYNCRLYNPVSAMNFIFTVTVDIAIYNICIYRCTFVKHPYKMVHMSLGK